MNLRKLELKDAPLMLEWMHDPSVVRDLQANFAAKTLDDCKKFILAAQDTTNDIHLAIVDEKDEYLGTVSLKHIRNNKAEFGITIRTCAMGQGISRLAMEKIIQIAFKEYNINEVYWCVNKNNMRAINFYDKNKYMRRDIYNSEFYYLVTQYSSYSAKQIDEYLWYSISADNVEK